MDTEFADVTGHDVTTIICICGNTVSGERLIQANSGGIPVHVGGDIPIPAGLAEWPEDEDPYTLCPRAAANTVTRSSKRQGLRRLLSGSRSPSGRLPRQFEFIGS